MGDCGNAREIGPLSNRYGFQIRRKRPSRFDQRSWLPEIARLKSALTSLDDRVSSTAEEVNQQKATFDILQTLLKRMEEVEERVKALERQGVDGHSEPNAMPRSVVRSWPAMARRLSALVIKAGLRAYGAMPLPPWFRQKVSRSVQRLAPRLHRSIIASVNGPNELRFKTRGPPDPIWLYDVVDHPEYRIGFWRLQQAVASHALAHGKFSHLIILPFFAVGGAEQSAMSFARAIRQTGGGVLLLAADCTLHGVQVPHPPPGAMMVDLSEYFPNAHYLAREAILMTILRMVRPDVMHVINSEVAWQLLIKIGARIRRN